jgi:hypothetical protein
VGDTFVGINCQFGSCTHIGKNLLVKKTLRHRKRPSSRLVHQSIRASPAIGGYGIRLIYGRPETITFFAKEAPFVVPACPVRASKAGVTLTPAANATLDFIRTCILKPET